VIPAQKHVDKVSRILETFAENYENLELLSEELSEFEDAPKSPEEIEAYLQAVLKCLVYREFGFEDVFPGVSYGDLVEKLYPPLKKIFEKNQNKTIFLTKDVREKWMGFHPFLTHFYGFEVDETHSRKVDVIVSYGPTQIKLDGIELYLPLGEPISSLYEVYIAFNPKDFSYFSPLLKAETGKIKINYVINSSEKFISVDIIKEEKERKELKVITRIPEAYVEMKEDAKELERLSGSSFSSYLDVKLKREELIEKIEDLNLTEEEFYKLLLEARKIDEKFREDLPLSEEKEFKLLYDTAARMIVNYVEKREREVARIREKFIERMKTE
jgi:hypothetical protein